MKIKDQANPFKPGFGRLPPTLAGRQRITGLFEDEVERLTRKETDSVAILLTGPRGCGKTVLLNWLVKHPLTRKLAVHDLTTDSDADEAFPPARKPRFSKTTRKTGVELGYSELRLGLQHEHSRDDPDPSSQNIAAKLLQLAAKKPLLMLLDETHMVNPVTARALFIAYQSTAQKRPMLLVMAGTPDTEMHLATIKASFVERTRIYPIDRLEPPAAIRAIADPLTNAGVRHDDETIARAAEEAQHYPYFLQFMGEALWDEAAAAGREVVDDSILEKALPAAKIRMQRLYLSRTKELIRHNMLAGAAELALASPSGTPDRIAVKTFIENLAFSWQLSRTPPPRNLSADEPRRSAEQLLLHTGFVWQPESDQWEFGIPSLATHVSHAAAEDIRAAMVRNQSGPALHSLLQKGFAFAATKQALIADATQVLDGQQELAERFVNGMTAIGVIGPTGTHSPDGESNLALLTPRVAAAALDAPEHAAA